MAALARGAAREADFSLAYGDGEGQIPLTVACDPRQPRGPQMTEDDREGQRALLPL